MNSVYQGADFSLFQNIQITSENYQASKQRGCKQSVPRLKVPASVWSWPLTPTYCWKLQGNAALPPPHYMLSCHMEKNTTDTINTDFIRTARLQWLHVHIFLIARQKASLYFGNGQVLITQYVKINKSSMLQSRSVPNIVPLPQSVPPAVDAGDFNSGVGCETCSTWCKNYLLFQLSLCCDEKWLDFASILSCTIKTFSRLYFIPPLQQAKLL